MFEWIAILVGHSRRKFESSGFPWHFIRFQCCLVYSEMLFFPIVVLWRFFVWGVCLMGGKSACLKLYEAFHWCANYKTPFSQFRMMNSQSGSACLKLAWNEIVSLKNFRQVWNINIPALRALKASISTCVALPRLFIYGNAFYIIKRILFVYTEWLVFQFHGWSDNHLCLFYSMMADSISIHLHIHSHAPIL